MKKSKLTVLELCLFGMLAALTFALKFVMSGLPNIEPVSLMILVLATVFGIFMVPGLYSIFARMRDWTASKMGIKNKKKEKVQG